MFALAWKELKQTWIPALLLTALLVITFVAWSLTSWRDSRVLVLPLGIPIIVAFLGSIVFAEERHSGTERFLTALPMRFAVRWAGKVAGNLALCAAASAILALVIVIAAPDEVVNILRFERMRLGFNRVLVALAVPFAMWAAALFYSAILDNALGAMVCAWATVAALGFLGVRSLGTTTLPAELILYWQVPYFGSLLAGPGLVFLTASLVLEGRKQRSLRPGTKAVGIASVVMLAGVAALACLTAIVTKYLTYYPLRSPLSHHAVWPGPDDSIILKHGTALSRRTGEGTWSRYEDNVSRAEPRRQDHNRGRRFSEGIYGLSVDRHKSLVNPDRNAIAFERYVHQRHPWLVARGLVYVLRHGVKWRSDTNPFVFSQSLANRRLCMFDTASGLVSESDVPRGPNIRVSYLGWIDDPARFVALVDTLERRLVHPEVRKILRTHLYLVSPDGSVAEKREGLEKLTAFRNDVMDEVTAFRDKDPYWGLTPAYATAPPFELIGRTLVTHKCWTSVPHKEGWSWEMHGRYLAYDIETGLTRTGAVEDPQHFLCFSPRFEWSLQVESSCKENVTRIAVQKHMSVPEQSEIVFYTGRLDGSKTRGPLPAIEIAGRSGEVRICDLADSLDKATVTVQFLDDERALLALIQETACGDVDRKGFEHVVFKNPWTQIEAKHSEDLRFRRVRAVYLDLETFERREVALPPTVRDFLADPHNGHVFYHNSRVWPESSGSYHVNTECVVLTLPTLETKEHFEWLDGTGPVLGFSVAWRTGSLVVGANTIITQTPAYFAGAPGPHLLLWRIGPEPTEVLPIPEEARKRWSH